MAKRITAKKTTKMSRESLERGDASEGGTYQVMTSVSGEGWRDS